MSKGVGVVQVTYLQGAKEGEKVYLHRHVGTKKKSLLLLANQVGQQLPHKARERNCLHPCVQKNIQQLSYPVVMHGLFCKLLTGLRLKQPALQ